MTRAAGRAIGRYLLFSCLRSARPWRHRRRTTGARRPVRSPPRSHRFAFSKPRRRPSRRRNPSRSAVAGTFVGTIILPCASAATPHRLPGSPPGGRARLRGAGGRRRRRRPCPPPDRRRWAHRRSRRLPGRGRAHHGRSLEGRVPDFRQWTVFRVQVGHFQHPFSLDENTSPVDLDFAYRSRAAAQLAPGRDWGVMVHGRLLRSIIGYEAGRLITMAGMPAPTIRIASTGIRRFRPPHRATVQAPQEVVAQRPRGRRGGHGE